MASSGAPEVIHGREGERLERKKNMAGMRDRSAERIGGTWSGRAGEVWPGGVGWLGGRIGKTWDVLIGATGKMR